MSSIINSNIELKPCPFCGCAAHIEVDDIQEPEMFWHYSPRCDDWGCLGHTFWFMYDTEEDAAKAWNARHESIKFKDFMDMYDNWNGMVVVNDNNLNSLVKNQAVFIVDAGSSLHDKEVVSFGFYDNELCVRVK